MGDGSSSILDPTMPQETSSGVASSSTSSADVSSVDDGASFLDPGTDTSVETGSCSARFGIPSQCSLWDQDCCHAEACKPWANDGGGAWNAVRCSPVSDRPAQLGEPCSMEGSTTSGVDTCDIGLMCFGVDPDTLEGTCAELCDGDPDDPSCTDPSQTCIVANDGALPLCHTGCDPLQPDCPEGQGCYGLPWTHFTCQSPDADIVGCPPGQTPVDPSLEPSCEAGGPCCVTLCDLTDAASCERPRACTPLFEDPLEGSEDVGYCRFPD